MSKVIGIIAEYNPFHNGHLYHFKESLKVTDSSYSIAIISGNFTQRGSTSLVDKWAKTEMAIKNGIDLVIELNDTDIIGSIYTNYINSTKSILTKYVMTI